MLRLCFNCQAAVQMQCRAKLASEGACTAVTRPAPLLHGQPKMHRVCRLRLPGRSQGVVQHALTS